MPLVIRRSAAWLAALALGLLAWAPGSARADWPTYRGDEARTGVDSSSGAALPFAAAWTSPDLGGAIWGQPLVHDGFVVVATESNQVVALSESTGQVLWRAGAGTPVPSSRLSCGDISPTVGITSTPVIDPSTNRVFVVADTLNGSTILHKLFAFNLSDGSAVAGFPVSAEPPGDVPADQLQRPGLALAGGQVIVGYGGNDGDCGSYHGWLVSIPETGGAEHAFEVEPGGSEGAIWSAGNAPAVDSAGNVWTSTGNGKPGSSYGYQESVLKLDANMNLLDHWAPSTWQSLDSGDADIGSSAPLLLPGDLVFQIGKQGIGYLLSASNLGGTGGAPLSQPSVCGGSYGGAVYNAGIIYVTCSTGLRALSLNATARSISALSGWQVNTAVNGPPIIAGGLVWATDWNHATLYGLNPQTGQTVVRQSTPSMEHFTTPSASDGKLFLATGGTVEAYTIAAPVAAPAPVATPAPPPPPPAPKCVLRIRSRRVKLHHPKRRKGHKHAPPAFATVGVSIRCDQAAQVTLAGTVTMRLPAKGKHGKARTETLRMARVRATVRPGLAKTFQMRLPPAALHALRRHIRESGAFTLTATDAGGSTQWRVRVRLRL